MAQENVNVDLTHSTHEISLYFEEMQTLIESLKTASARNYKHGFDNQAVCRVLRKIENIRHSVIVNKSDMLENKFQVVINVQAF